MVRKINKIIAILIIIHTVSVQGVNAQLTPRMLWDSACSFKSGFGLTETQKEAEVKKAVAGDSMANAYFFTIDVLIKQPPPLYWKILKGQTITERLKTTWFTDINNDGLPDFIHYGFDIDKKVNQTYLYLNNGNGYTKLIDKQGVPNYAAYDAKGRLVKLGIYRHFCCNHSFDYIYAFDLKYPRKHAARINIDDIWYTVHYEKDKPDSFDTSPQKVTLKRSFDLPSYFPQAPPFPKGELMDALVLGRVGLEVGTVVKVLYKTNTVYGNRYFIETDFPADLKGYSKYTDRGDVPTKIVGWTTQNELY